MRAQAVPSRVAGVKPSATSSLKTQKEIRFKATWGFTPKQERQRL